MYIQPFNFQVKREVEMAGDGLQSFKRGKPWTEEEDNLLASLVAQHGQDW